MVTKTFSADKNDLTLKASDGFFNFRVGFLAFTDDSILLQKSNNGYWFVPGGRVSFQESTEETIRREVSEELSLEINDVEFSGVVENFFRMDGFPFHEINVYYRIRLPEDFVPPGRDGAGKPVIFQWHKLKDLREIDIKPVFLKDGISKFRSGIYKHTHREVA